MGYFSTTKTIGILGGGQLGKMLLNTTRQWDINTHVLDPNNLAPARIGSNAFVQGDLMDYQTVIDFGEKVDILTIEIENVNAKALAYLEKKGVQVYPQAAVIEIIQNKCRQKEFYKKNSIPTAPFQLFGSKETLKDAIVRGLISFPFVWKSESMGYDGYGVKIIRSNQDLETINGGGCMAEDLVNIEKEIGVIVCRSVRGETVNYPSVEMEFHPTSNQVEYVLSPARISKTIEKKAQEIARQVSIAYRHVGLLAVELFLTKEGEIWVNEVAPRPHNSGHYSIEASYTSQFEQHIRALLNLPLGSTDNKVSGVMVNLVGAQNHQGLVHYKNMEHVLGIEGVYPHIYGKKETRPFRKMGHITIVNKNLETARKIAEQVKETIEVISI
ncbi:MAG: 5-(carboxyamino)imidazole ribonucleotide synthase [Flavobacteriaceae bacterium]|jgi:5-(carboxyamino)imidazole ribonucleotide synthase|nr:5-(carboxyamino)imidazole ribonucleotide synthase [Flavobacteriaceae bacterium]MDG2062903.1 5-(carboxyamino)imidazole ribonucleotide synthase [Flavobacteriaceae bacterium]|tara:strand:- start:351 stop:1505 length:1155 start_codon:yes stop_codon:yes gene_type:complete